MQSLSTPTRKSHGHGARLASTLVMRLLLLMISIAISSLASGDGPKAGRILVDKSERTLVLFSQGKPIRSYPVALGLNPSGHKRYEGDKRTPEGIYLIDGKNSNSAFHLSLHISYPNERDVRAARERGWEPGGQIVIHGLPTGLVKTSSKYDVDWTDGCIAVSNTAIEEIWALVDEGTLIEITP